MEGAPKILEPEPRTIVRNKRDGRIGVVVSDPFGICARGEVSVVYQGDPTSYGTFVGDLEIIGFENAQADLLRCGAGKEKQHCMFLGYADEEPICQRYGSFHWTLVINTPKESRRQPTEIYPHCQLPPNSEETN